MPLAVVPTKVVAGEGPRLLLCVLEAPVAGDEPLVAHRNARLTPVTRLELVLEVEAGWSQAEVARRFRVSRPTVAKWVRRFREAGADGLEGRNSAPHRQPRRTAPELEQRICAVRRSEGFGPHRIALGARARPFHCLRRAQALRPQPPRPAASREQEAAASGLISSVQGPASRDWRRRSQPAGGC